MSIESTFKNRLDINLNYNKPIQSTLSQREQSSVTRHSLKSTSKENYRQGQSQSRTRTKSVSADLPADTTTELIASNKQDNEHDTRHSELKPTVERHDHTAVNRRNSTPQLHLSSLFPHAFRNQKHHHKTNTKDEINTINMTPNNFNASFAASSNHFGDIMTMTGDPSFTSIISNHFNDLQFKQDQDYSHQLKKSATSLANISRIIPSNSNERLLLYQNESSIPSSSFIFEENISEPRSGELLITDSYTPICVSEMYREDFFEYFHTNYYGELDYEGPFIASLRCVNYKTPLGDICEARALIRTQYRNCSASEIVNATNENNVLQILFNKKNLPAVRAYGTIGDPKANEKIYLFDKTNDERYNSKIGVIYQRLNQRDEYDIFSNDYPSIEMLDFLEILGERVRLKSFPKYRGDLDIKEDLHGEYSYHTVYENHEIMFNVAPLIPSTKANGQCIERKGLVGNAFVCIVFQEPGAIFSPDFISGKVTQIYITVQPIIFDGQYYYKIGIWRRNDITSIIDPPGGIYKNDQFFLSYFLILLLNSVNVAIESPSLRSRVYEQRQRLKYEELKKLTNLFSLGPIPDFTSEIDNIHYQMDTRPNTRNESFASNTTVTTSDSASTNPGRTSPVSSKKKGFSKLFGVFSSRSASISSPSTLPQHINNDGLPGTPQTPSSTDAPMSLPRTSVSSSKEIAQRRSIKSSQAPVLPIRPSISHTISIQPPTPSTIILNPFISDNLTQTNLLNTTALNITPRNRSNSSPDDAVNTNTSLSFPVSKISEEDPSTHSSDDEDSEDESSEDDRSLNRRVRYP